MMGPYLYCLRITAARPVATSRRYRPLRRRAARTARTCLVIRALVRQRATAAAACRRPGALEALDGDDLKALPFEAWVWRGERIYQFDRPRGITGFPEHPADVLRSRR